MMSRYGITPIAKPRMTRSDKWKKRKCVLEYWAYKERLIYGRVKVAPSGAHVIFHLPMPKSWSNKKKLEMHGKPHTSKPDVDNLLKGFMDALFKNDAHVSDIKASKVWAYNGAIEVI